jgi:signal transduction histidine kinase
MMTTEVSFETKAKLGYALLILSLAVIMTVSVRRLASVADEQVALLRREESEITLVERLRWNSELIVSDGRGYLISGDSDLRKQVQQAEARFDQSVRALNDQTLSPRGAALVADAEAAAKNFRRTQEELLAARRRSANTGLLVRRFESELLPLRRALEQALARLVGHKEAALDTLYDTARAARTRFELRTYGLLGSLTLTGLAIAWYLATRLGRAYRQERRAHQAARQAIAARDEIMGIVAHDLRNPLGAITMKATLLRMGADPDKMRAQAESIEKIAMRMEYLIRTMLDVATIEAGKFSVMLQTCAVDELVCETAEMFESLAASKQVRFVQNVKESGLAIRADRERVLQVLSNIIGNALRFTPPGGHVTLSIDRRAAEARFSIFDSGPGIASEHLSRVFDRFWKDETGKKGTGLGLFIAKGIVGAHEGRIWVESEPGHGAQFYFTLPLAEATRHSGTLGMAERIGNNAARRSS